MTQHIYQQFDAAFKQVQSYVILKDGVHVANINFKFPRDGAGRLFCYLHVRGLEMVRDYAGGYGYAKKDAAVSHAIKKVKPFEKVESAYYEAINLNLVSLKEALKNDSGASFINKLIDAGFTVLQAV